jgi:hypothetical protein
LNMYPTPNIVSATGTAHHAAYDVLIVAGL